MSAGVSTASTTQKVSPAGERPIASRRVVVRKVPALHCFSVRCNDLQVFRAKIQTRQPVLVFGFQFLEIRSDLRWFRRFLRAFYRQYCIGIRQNIVFQMCI